MNEKLQTVAKSLADVLCLWNTMKISHMDDAADDADRFQMVFYEFVERVQDWVQSLDDAPVDTDGAREDSRFSALFDQLPEPLQLPFETELEMILSRVDRRVDNAE